MIPCLSSPILPARVRHTHSPPGTH
uniref:Uncharacterized protein n=1 Tax=Anguilla anguilla TaxID=7936 RepID=A0A0E9PDA4_ANGAN